MGTKVLALMNMGFFVDAELLNKGIYYTSVPCLYKDGSTIKSLVDAGKTMKDILGYSTVSDEYFDNLKQCELVEVEISPLTDNVSTSQQQTIERLREIVKKYSIYMIAGCNDEKEQIKLAKEIEQLLKETDQSEELRDTTIYIPKH